MKIIYLLSLLLLCGTVKSNILFEYLENVGTFLGYKKPSNSKTEVIEQDVPYEVSVVDEKFISEAAKLSGTALSELDSCQHRVVLKLQASCEQLNDEQLAKMAIMLLNCQAVVEDRKLHPCTDEMSIKDCTSNMDLETWNNYNLISNRVRAVCYSVRQVQFRGLASLIINKLVHATQSQLKTLDKITEDQERLSELAELSLHSVINGNELLKTQQKDLEKAQFHTQLATENNLQRLVNEKQVIIDIHDQLLRMSQTIQTKLAEASTQLEKQSDVSHIIQKEILDELLVIQRESQTIYKKIEDSSNLIAKHNELAHVEYQAILSRLSEVNDAVHFLVTLGGTRTAVEEHLAWLNLTFGGSELAFERLYAISWHLCFLLFAMITCAFLAAPMNTRVLTVICPSLNLALTLLHSSYGLNPLQLTVTMGALLLGQTIFTNTSNLRQQFSIKKVAAKLKQKLSYKKISSKLNGLSNEAYTNSQAVLDQARSKYIYNRTNKYDDEVDDPDFDFVSPIPKRRITTSRSRSQTPLHLNGLSRGNCLAKTRMGLLCKLTTLPGRDFCHRHQGGDSIYGE